MQHEIDRTHFEDTQDRNEVQPAGGDPAFIVLCVEETTDRISFTQLVNVPLDRSYDSAIEGLVTVSHSIPRIAAPTHVSSLSIASRAG